jgi:hypothetical protein
MVELSAMESTLVDPSTIAWATVLPISRTTLSLQALDLVDMTQRSALSILSVSPLCTDSEALLFACSQVLTVCSATYLATIVAKDHPSYKS